MSETIHGGRLLAAQRRNPGARRPWIDLSTGINPDAYPFTAPPLEAWTRLPEPEDVAALEAVAAAAYGVRDAACVVAAPGTQALIQVLPNVLPQACVGVPGLTYAEHAAAWRAGGAAVVDGWDADALVVCNPNNPDGRRLEPAALLGMRRGLLVVDEAFADFEAGVSLGPSMPVPPPGPGVVVLRSFGKAYGLAGVRLGFAVAAPDVAGRLRAALGPWAVSGPAVAIGREALADGAWRAGAAVRAHAAAGRLRGVLERAGLAVVGGTALFVTVAHVQAAQIAGRLAGAGVLVRAFAAAPTWLRFGLPGDEGAWARLEGALR